MFVAALTCLQGVLAGDRVALCAGLVPLAGAALAGGRGPR
jgi:hypothetical protein